MWITQIAPSGPIKGIWCGCKRILDCLGHDCPKAEDNVQLHCGVDYATLCGGTDRLITVNGEDEDDIHDDIDSVTGGHNI